MTEVGGDVPGAECAFVNLAHYSSTGKTMLFNIDFARSHTIELHRGGKTERVVLGPSEFRRFDRAQ